MVIREFVDEHNRKALEWLHEDYAHVGKQLRRRGVAIEHLTERAMAFKVAVPSWGVGTGGHPLRALRRAGRAPERSDVVAPQPPSGSFTRKGRAAS